MANIEAFGVLVGVLGLLLGVPHILFSIFFIEVIWYVAFEKPHSSQSKLLFFLGKKKKKWFPKKFPQFFWEDDPIKKKALSAHNQMQKIGETNRSQDKRNGCGGKRLWVECSGNSMQSLSSVAKILTYAL